MDDFPSLFAKDFGIKPQGKSAPMAPPRNSGSTGGGIPDFGLRSDFGRSSYSNSKSAAPIFDDHDRDVGNIFNDLYGGPPKHSSESRSFNAASSSLDYDAIFKDEKAKHFSVPVYDKPVYDDDIFDGVPGLKSSSVPSTAKYEDVFSSMSSPPQTKNKVQSSSPFDDLLGGIGRKDAEVKNQSLKAENDAPAFDDLLPGFGRSASPFTARSNSETNVSQKPFSNSTKNASNIMEDPFVVLETKSAPADTYTGVFTDPLEDISELNGPVNTKVGTTGVSDDIDPLGSFDRSVPPIRSASNYSRNDGSPQRTHRSGTHTSKEPYENANNESYSKRRTPSDDDVLESPQTAYDVPNISANYWQSSGQTTSPPPYTSSNNDTSSHVHSSRGSVENSESLEDIWLTVSEVPLFTQPTMAPPPSRPPPPRPPRLGQSERGSFSSTNARRTNTAHSEFSEYSHSSQSFQTTGRSAVDELEDFAMAGTRSSINDHLGTHPDEDASSAAAASAAAMKEAMEKAEVKFRHAKEMRERENLRASRNRDQFDDNPMQDADERELKERQERLERDRQQREKDEEREKTQRRLEKEREQAEREREKARQAVERATREARERAAAEARTRAEKVAVGKASAEARERAERAAVQRAQAEARERAAADARERAEKATAEAREREKAKAAVDAKLRAERAAVERAAAEARERAAAGARERAAAAARVSQPKNVNDMDDFFSMGRASSAPRTRSNSSDPLFETQNKPAPQAARRTSTESSPSMKKASSATNIVDDLTSIFAAPASSAGEFQEMDGETEERRRARMERHQRTQERAAKALAEKNQRDLDVQREQAERHRIAETLDMEIKRWAAGKEGNLRALLSTLQYVLWPECGWQPVSLTDLITAPSVKKVYRKATLCIHPDKVQQKGANLQQKYIAEKVFDLLKEAWNKFNSEELF